MRKRADRQRPGFTLVELMVVTVVIVLVAAIALPTIAQIVGSGAQEQAYNLLAAQLASARALAMLESTYTGVHVQPADEDRVEDGDLEERIYTAVVIYDHENGYFDVADGFDPKPLPGKTAFGEISDYFVTKDSDVSDYRSTHLSDDDDIEDFMTFTFIFSPDGSLVRTLHGKDSDGDDYELTFSDEDGFFRGDDRLWDRALADDDEQGVLAVCLFNYTDFTILDSGSNRADMLNEAGRFLPVNVHTGQVFPRQ